VKRGAPLASLTLWLWAAGSAHAAGAPWPDTFLARVEALALLQTLNVELLSHDSATLTLEHWCAEHHLADAAQVVAQRVAGADKAVDDAQRKLLQVSAQELVRYRRVHLKCGGVQLSQADNWYVPSRLTAAMNAQLDSSDTPFGKVVAALHFQRHTIAATLLWQPLPPGWESASDPSANGTAPQPARTTLQFPPAVLEHRALLTLPDGTPFSEVVETYGDGVLAFPAPPTANMSSR
jgi:chorismate-pyruvate lyase